MSADKIGIRTVTCTFSNQEVDWKSIASGLAPTILKMIIEEAEGDPEVISMNLNVKP
ncbi:MAG: hypothetical protein AB9921_06045 [Erysipelotrichaceae bacterium]